MNNATTTTPTAREILGPAPVEPLTVEQPPAKLIIDPPLRDSLKIGRVVIQYYAQNLHIRPIYGEAAVAVSPRIGHIHGFVDDATSRCPGRVAWSLVRSWPHFADVSVAKWRDGVA